MYQSITFINFAISNRALFFNKSCIFITLSRIYRLLAYRNFTCWMHGRLGPGIRRVIPFGIVERIRKQFLEEDGVYSQGDNDSAEYEFQNLMHNLQHLQRKIVHKVLVSG